MTIWQRCAAAGNTRGKFVFTNSHPPTSLHIGTYRFVSIPPPSWAFRPLSPHPPHPGSNPPGPPRGPPTLTGLGRARLAFCESLVRFNNEWQRCSDYLRMCDMREIKEINKMKTKQKMKLKGGGKKRRGRRRRRSKGPTSLISR